MSDSFGPLPGARSSVVFRSGDELFLARWLSLLLPLLAFLLCISGSALLPLIDRDEPRFAEAAREMAERGEWWVPYFNGAYRLDKPPLIYWLMGISFRAFGENELGARMPSIALDALLCLLLFRIGRSFYGLRGGVVAALSASTCLQVLIHGRLAVADMPMVVATTLAQWAILRLLEGGKSCWFWTLWISLGLGFLAKGPIAWAVPLMTVVLWRLILWRQSAPWGRLHLFKGALVATGIVALWGIPALLLTHGAFWTQGMGEHVLRRGVEAFDGRPHFWGYYLVSSLVSLFPWSAFLGWILVSLRERYSSRSAFLVAWFFAPFLLFTPYATQLPHYLLPGFPAFFLLLGQAATTPTRSRPLRLTIFWFVWSIGFLGGCLALLATLTRPWEPRLAALRLALWALGGIFFSLCLLALAAKATLFSDGTSSPRPRPSRLLPLGLGIVSPFALAGCFWLLGASLRTVEPALALRPLWKSLPQDTVFRANGYTEPSLVFYSGRRWVMDAEEEGPGSSASERAPSFSVRLQRERTLQDAFRWLFSGRPALRDSSPFYAPPAPSNGGWLGASRIEGFDSARFSWVDLEVRSRPGSEGIPPKPQ
ncbi:glycosyltransferase family 39 protein [Methylacidimicrobium sp. B4]|uniref:ArnT family glycosyltransferase n=1 Tax=Methylacidimicrobium sp. B4 TaxID=2796139 RepID=UPI001A8F0606|nr:glycosyltransferase family 39 protein [Methylacidimicrobium sp. B4]QSR84471.1 glycosyltransferase family 39 protein [Methylacidimicrobium sp. B4]